LVSRTILAYYVHGNGVPSKYRIQTVPNSTEIGTASPKITALQCPLSALRSPLYAHIGKSPLFNSYASSDEGQLPSQFFDIHDKIVEACNGLPLSLQVMGAFLQDKERIRSWERAFQRMKRGRCLDGDEGLWRTLRVSFDALKDEEKKLYLDIACFFPMGSRKESVLRTCAYPSHVLDVLVDKSLVKINVYGYLEMHDHLRDMGRMIVEREEVYKGTRIWKKDMIHSANGQTNKVIYM
jgi:hypothetical protein